MRILKRPFCFWLMIACLMIAAAILIAYPTAARGQAREAKLKAPGSISGHVLLNGKAAAGTPVAAYGGDAFNRRAPTARTVTDSEGSYTLSPLPPAQYQVTTLAPNLTTGEQSVGASFGFPFFNSSKNIILAAGEIVTDIDIKLVRGAVITGRVTDAENKPLVEQRVALQIVDENGNQGRPTSPLPFNNEMYLTDDRGVYRIYGLAAGRYKVSIGSDTTNGGVVGVNRRRYYPRTFYPDVTDQTKASVLELTEGGEATNIDIKVGGTADSFGVSGRVVDSETGQPVPGVRIGFVMGPDRPGTYYSGLTSDARGEFKFDGLAPGHYGAYVTPEGDRGDYYSDPTYFDIVDRDASEVVIKTIHGLTVSGIVVTEGEGQKSVAAQVPGLRVSANVIQTGRTQLNNSGSSEIAADGSFQITGMRPGRISMGTYVNGPSQLRPTISRIEHAGVGLTQGFELQPGQSISGLRVVINYGTGAIRGTVRFEGGTLVPDVRTFVRLQRQDGHDAGGAQLDSRGHFVINSVVPGTYDITLQIAYPPSGRPQRPAPPMKQSVTVSNDTEAEVNFVVDLKPKEGGP